MSTFSIPSERFLKLDGPTLITRLEAIRQYCQTIPFDHQLTWADVMFSDGLSPQALGQRFMEQRGDLKPHQALLLAFLQAMQTPQALFDTLPMRHRDFFYRDHLRLSERPASPDRVNVSFSLQSSANELTLPAGLLLDAGTDARGRPRRYQLEQSLSVNQGKFTDLRWVRPGANQAISHVAYDATVDAQWPADGVNLFAPDAIKDQMVCNARLIIDERLRLTSGVRVITLEFDTALEPLSAYISAGGKWQELEVTSLSSSYTVNLTGTAEAPPFSGASGLDGIASDSPVLKLLYCNGGTVPPVSNMRVGVHDTRTARVHTPEGEFGNGEACYPFGLKPDRKSRFTLMTEEWQGLPAVKVALTPHWQALPSQTLLADTFEAQLALHVELMRASSASSVHKLFQMVDGGVQSQSIIFKLKDDDLSQRTTVLDCTLHQPGGGLAAQEGRAQPKNDAPLEWRQLQIDWRSEEFAVPHQYLQHPFGYGKQPWELSKPEPWESYGMEVDASTIYLSDDIFSLLRPILGWESEITLEQMYARGLRPLTLWQIDTIPRELWIEEGGLSNEEMLALITLSPFDEVAPYLKMETALSELFQYITLEQAAGLPFSQESVASVLMVLDRMLWVIDSVELLQSMPVDQFIASQFPTLQASIVAFFTQIFSSNRRGDTVKKMLQILRMIMQSLMGGITNSTLYLGFSNLKSGDTTTLAWSVKSVLFQSVHWDYLTRNGWQPLALGLDQTANLSRSGLLTYTVPADAASETTLMPVDRHWLRARVAIGAQGLSSHLLGIESNGASALLVDAPAVAAEHFRQPLPAGTITHTVQTLPGLASVRQPWPSTCGRGPESAEAFSRRVASELGHRGRAVTWRDIQTLALEHFENVHTVKLPDPGRHGIASPSSVVVVPASGHADNTDRRRPLFSSQRLTEMGEHLRSLASPWLQLELVNPNYRNVVVRYQVAYVPSINAVQGAALLRLALQRRYMPWIESERAEISIGQELDYYDMVDFIQRHDFVQRVTELTLDGNCQSVQSAADTVLILNLPGEQTDAAPAQPNIEKLA
ncbi:hypothetical protein [Pseudomonas koreensis]|uniref:hypothetical protein n=1 Tax=Pseudomonas koreensis TaxID=198620 RepID=UPI003F852B93